jgi:hypothetical protein
MELHRFFRYAIEKMCKEKKSLNHFYLKQQNLSLKKDALQHTLTTRTKYSKQLTEFIK